MAIRPQETSRPSTDCLTDEEKLQLRQIESSIDRLLTSGKREFKILIDASVYVCALLETIYRQAGWRFVNITRENGTEGIFINCCFRA